MAKWWKNLIRIGNPVVNLVSSIAGLFKKKEDSLVGRVFKSGQSIIDSVFDATGSGAVDNWIKGVSGSGLTTAEIQQNEWNAQQAQEQRDWTAQMDNTKYQRQTADMLAAGLNPAMMYGQGYSASTPSGAAASGGDAGSPSAGLFDSLLSVFFAKQRLQNLKNEGKVLETQAEKNQADADYTRTGKKSLETDITYKQLLIDYYPKLTGATIERIGEEANKLRSDVKLNDASTKVRNAEADLVEVQTSIQNIEKDWRERILAAQTKQAKAAAIHDYAEAAWKQYEKTYAEGHGGVTPGRDQWTGFAATMAESISHVVGDVKNFVGDLVPDWMK